MEESEVIHRANALGVRAMSEKEIQEVWLEAKNTINRLEDLDVSIGLFGLLNETKAMQFKVTRKLVTELAEEVLKEVIRKREAGEFVKYR
jgi:hypothetical protein